MGHVVPACLVFCHSFKSNLFIHVNPDATLHCMGYKFVLLAFGLRLTAAI